MRIIVPVREGHQRQERLGGAPVAQVDLDGVWLPLPRWALCYEEVDPEAPHDPLAGQAGADLQRLCNDKTPVRLVRREATAEEALSVRAAQELVVGRDHLVLAVRATAHLHAGAAHAAGHDPFLDDAALFA